MKARNAVLAALVASALAPATAARGEEVGGFAVDAHVGYSELTSAKSSAKAVFGGSSGGVVYGGGLRYALRNHFYVGAWARSFAKDGERVFIADATSPVFPLGHPLEVRIVPIQATVGYRLSGARGIVPYVGAGGGLTRYHEESVVAGETESTTQTKTSWHLLAGVEVGQGRFRFATEAGYSFVPNALGLGGVSKVYGETDIGGFSFVGKAVFSFSHR